MDGHTNQLPGGTQNYPSGWELSSARASSVVRYLIERYHVPEPACPRPVTRTPVRCTRRATRSVALNRRVEVVVMSSLPADERLLPGIAKAVTHPPIHPEDDIMAKDGNPEGAEAPKKSKKMLIIIVLAVLLLGGGGAGAYFMFFKSSGEEEAVQHEPGVVVALEPSPSTWPTGTS